MNQAITLKAQAVNLVAAMAEMGVKLTKSQGLEAIAKQYGVASWDALSGMLKAKPAVRPAPILADMPGPPGGVFVEQGPRREYYKVDCYDEAGFALLHSESALLAHIEANPDSYDEGLDTDAINLSGDRGSLHFTFREMLGLKYSKICGMGTWELTDGDTFLNFVCGDIWSPPEGGVAEPVQLPAIPQTVKSVKGVKVLQLTSHDGAGYDKFYLVPPHLDINGIRGKLDKAIEQMKQRDRDNQDNPDYQEYDADDVHAEARKLGIEPIEPEMGSDNWDC